MSVLYVLTLVLILKIHFLQGMIDFINGKRWHWSKDSSEADEQRHFIAEIQHCIVTQT